MAKRSRRPDYKRLRCARLSVCLLSALLVEACAGPSATKLRVASWLPPSHVLVRDILVPWAERVRVATDDRVEIEDVKELVETVISDSWSFPDLRP